MIMLSYLIYFLYNILHYPVFVYHSHSHHSHDHDHYVFHLKHNVKDMLLIL